MVKQVFLAASLIMACACTKQKEVNPNKVLAQTILSDTLLNKVDSMAHEVVKGGFNAGDGYGEVWIRDYNTFIELAMEVMPDSLIQQNLLTFFHFQGKTGDIVDGFVDRMVLTNNSIGYYYRVSESEPRFAAHKNTVETDHEASLVQAVYKYVTKSGNTDFLNIEVAGKTVAKRLEWSLEYLQNEKMNNQYGLLIGATTADWGDVQPEHPWGVEIDENTHYAIDIYDNAMYVIAINDFLALNNDPEKEAKWTKIKNDVVANVRKHLWDETNKKYIPHIYLDGSPFPADFDENQIYYHGGTAVAIEAGLLTSEEIALSNAKMLDNMKAANAQTIGLTMYPTYPDGFFQNKGMHAYGYQNGGDWTWFGGRMIQALIANDFVQEAYDEASPMMQRIINNNGFYEWYTPAGEPKGSGTFRGEAGVLYKSIAMLKEWANNQLIEK